MKRCRSQANRFAAVVSLSLIFAKGTIGQTIGYQGNSQSMESTPAPSPGISSVSLSQQNPFAGSVPQGKATAEALPLSFKDAIDLGLKNNLGLLLQSDAMLAARGQKWKELSDLLPNLSGAISENASQVNLQAQGIRIPGIPPVIGPFGFFDARLYLKQSILNLKALDRTRGARANEKAAEYTYKDARDIVVLAVGNAYLQALAGAARVDSAQAQFETAQALHNKAVDQLNAGVSPAIDSLRAKVQMQSREQQLIVAKNDYAK